MAKKQSKFPGALDTGANWAPAEGLDTDRQPADILASDAVDLIEDAILELETALGGAIGTGPGLWDADKDTGIQVEEGADDDIIRFDTFGSERMVILKNGKIGMGTATVPHGGVGYALLALEGADASGTDGPYIQITTDTDDYPLMQLGFWNHNQMWIDWDAYDDGTERSSDIGSNFQFIKITNLFKLRYDSGIVQGAAITWNNGIVLDTSGNVTKPNNPAFLVKPTSAQLNITAGGSTTVVWGTEVFDVGSNFASNTFTAPVTGKYRFDISIAMDNLDTASANYQLSLVTSNGSYYSIMDSSRFSADLVSWTISFSILVDMDATDTAYISIYQQGGTAQTDIRTNSWFSGSLVS